MHKMLFCTGVKPWNHTNKEGRSIKAEHEEWKDGVLHIAYYLEREPEDNLTLQYLVPAGYLENLQPYQVAIKIVAGGMTSDYAIFLKRNLE